MKTAILITARLKSTRLPLKVLKPIMGRPMLEHLVNRLKRAKRPQGIILCTSTLCQDDPLAEQAARYPGVEVFRGDPDDVLLRLAHAAETFGVNTIVSCTADNPFVDPEYVDFLVEFHLNGAYDYSRTEGMPFGTFSYALRRDAIVRACEIKATSDTEVWGGYFTETGEFSCGVLRVTDPAIAWPELRLTVDTPEDFELATQIIQELSASGVPFGLREIVQLCRNRPDLVRLNKHIVQKAGAPTVLKKGG